MNRLSCTVACAYTPVHAHGDAETQREERNHYENALSTLVRASGLSHAFFFW